MTGRAITPRVSESSAETPQSFFSRSPGVSVCLRFSGAEWIDTVLVDGGPWAKFRSTLLQAPDPFSSGPVPFRVFGAGPSLAGQLEHQIDHTLAGLTVAQGVEQAAIFHQAPANGERLDVVRSDATQRGHLSSDEHATRVIDGVGVGDRYLWTVAQDVGQGQNSHTTRVYDMSQCVPANPFVDNDGHIFENAIEWLAAEGITQGCNPPTNNRFCPDDPVTRGQMAAFLKRALGG